MQLLRIELWALWCACGLMVLASVVNARTLTVPNRLSLTAALAGWLTALLVSCPSVGVPSQGGGLVASLVASGVGFLLLAPLYTAGALGAGCVKMQMAFGGWVGCALPLLSAALVVGLGTLIGAALAVVWAVAKSKAAERNRALRVDARLLPAQVPLSLGSICAALLLPALGWL